MLVSVELTDLHGDVQTDQGQAWCHTSDNVSDSPLMKRCYKVATDRGTFDP